MVLATTLIGTEEMVRARLVVWRDAGVEFVTMDSPLAFISDAARDALS